LLIYGRAQLNAPTQSAVVPLVRQTWLCKKKGKYVALKVIRTNKIKFEVVETTTEKALGFNPSAGSARVLLPVFTTTVKSDAVKE